MNKLLFFSFFLILHLPSYAQIEMDTVTTLGKRKNIVWGRTIKQENLGNMLYTYYYPIYFKTQINTKWQGIGLLGGRIKPYLRGHQTALNSFQKYRIKKAVSFVMIPLSISSLGAWAYTSIDLTDKKNIPFSKALFSPKPLSFLSLYFVAFYSGMYFNTNADKDLLRAVQLKKGKKGYLPNKKSSISIKAPQNTESLVGLTMNF